MPARPPLEEHGYRICYVDMPGLMTMEGKDYHGNPFFAGSSKGVLDHSIELLFDGANWNHTMILSDKWKSVDDNKGCVGSLHRNESDIALAVVDYPTRYYETVDPYRLLFEEPLAIVSSYDYSYCTYEVDILGSAATTFTLDLWFLVLTTFAVATLVWFLGNRRQKAKNNSLFQIFSLFMNQGSLIQSSLFSKIFATVLSFGFFLLINYYCDSLTTEMVVAKKPFMFDSLEKIMSKPETIPHFVSIFDTFRIFKYAEESTLKKMFWNKYAHLEATNAIFLELTNHEAVADFLYEGYFGRAVTIMNRLWVTLLTSLSCKLRGAVHNQESPRLLSATIFPKEVYQMGLVRNARLRTTNYGRYMKRRTTLFFEAGLTYIFREELAKGPDMGPFDYEEFRQCMIDTYSSPYIHVSHISMQNFKNVNFFYFACILAALITLGVEKVTRRNWKFTKVHPIKEKPSKSKKVLDPSLDMKPFKRNITRRMTI